jgi:hypothetical protein
VRGDVLYGFDLRLLAMRIPRREKTDCVHFGGLLELRPRDWSDEQVAWKQRAVGSFSVHGKWSDVVGLNRDH